MTNTDWYTGWFHSTYYKILYRDRNEEEAESFVEALINYLAPPPGCKMLDIACGEGRYALQLAQHGYDVTGIDISQAGIENAKALSEGCLHFYVHDMRTPFCGNKYDYAFNFFTSFGYFEDANDNCRAANAFAECLKEGGILIVDYLNSTLTAQQLVPSETIARGDYTFEIQRSISAGSIIKNIRFTDMDGKPHHYAERVNLYTLDDFRRIFADAGLTLTATFGNYSLEPFDVLSSPRLIMVYKKTNAEKSA